MIPAFSGRSAGRATGLARLKAPQPLARTKETRLHGRKGANLPSFTRDRRWPGVHVAVAKGGDRSAAILSTIAANNLRGIATSAI
jgi:hypothetical protein